ncbi:MAG: hypothetical protein LCH88_01725 [Proteobacteria bacterium]|nr:hypothetical protein [Pseudomonadota bacterium]
MTTSAELKRYVVPILERFSELGFTGRWLVVKPLQHVFRGILLDATLPRDEYRPQWFAIEMFGSVPSLSPMHGFFLGRRGHGPFSILDPRSLGRLADEIERVALPRLRPIASIGDFIGHANLTEFSFPPVSDYPLRYSVLEAARGNFKSARGICEWLKSGRSGWTGPGLEDEYRPILEDLYPLLRDEDRAGLARLLHAWEARNIATYRLERMWEPTPFPFEVAAG